MTTENFCFYLQNRLIQTSHTEEVNGTVILSPIVFPGLLIIKFNHNFSKLDRFTPVTILSV
jgi:hypothetical protein